MRHQNFDHGVIVGKRFTVAAAEEMAQESIQQVSDEYMPPIKPENIYLTISNCTNILCKTKCGKTPSNESDCRSWNEGDPCRVRTVSNNSAFHYEQGWMNLMKDDLRQILSLAKHLKNTANLANASKVSNNQTSEIRSQTKSQAL
jgi:hypothetical protein